MIIILLLLLFAVLLDFYIYNRHQVILAEKLLEIQLNFFMSSQISEKEYDENRTRILENLSNLQNFIYKRRNKIR